MLSVLSILVILVVSILAIRVATIALTHTGLARQTARFQSHSAFTGVGFTTDEAEKVVNHPLRRRIVIVLMLLGNVGIVSVVASLMLTFLDTGEQRFALATRLGVLFGGIAVLWLLTKSSFVERRLAALIDRALTRWTDIDTQDYSALLRLAGDYKIHELAVEPADWLAGKTLAELSLRDEGVQVLGIVRDNGTYVGLPRGSTPIEADDVLILYGRDEAVTELDERSSGPEGDREHLEAIEEQREVDRREREEWD